jgi:hypothetical protein
MRALSCFGLLLLTVCGMGNTAASQHFVVAQSQNAERVLGLLALPEVFGDYPCELFEVKKLNLYASPSKEKPPVGVIERLNPPKSPAQPDCDLPHVAVRRPPNATTTEDLPFDESGYEMVKAVAYERAGNWFRIALAKGSAWVERQNPEDEFMAYPAAMMEEDIATYLRSGWDGNSASAPGGPLRPAPSGWRALRNEEIPIRVLETQVVNGEAWVRVKMLTESCGRSLPNLAPFEAWIPAYRNRFTSVWFYSRGC